METYKILVEKDTDGIFFGKVLGLDGCHSDGETLEELMSNLKEAIKLWEEVNSKEILNIPQNAFIETLKV